VFGFFGFFLILRFVQLVVEGFGDFGMLSTHAPLKVYIWEFFIINIITTFNTLKINGQ
jgi:hypothetical protein